MLEQVSPEHKSESIGGAFLFDQAALARFHALARVHLGDECEFSYALTCRDGTTFKSNKESDLALFPFHHTRERKKFEVESRVPADLLKRVSISFEYDPFFREAYIYISAKSGLMELFHATKSFVDSTRSWYSRLYHPSLVYVWIIGTFVQFLAVLVAFYAKNEILRFVGTAVSVIYLIVFLAVSISRRLLFDRIVVLFGGEIQRQQRRASVRRVVFGTMIFGTFVAIVGGFTAGWFTNAFASRG